MRQRPIRPLFATVTAFVARLQQQLQRLAR
jgi:hypothetical protein